MVEFALKVTIVIFITEIIISPVKIFTEAAASVASTVATALTLHLTVDRHPNPPVGELTTLVDVFVFGISCLPHTNCFGCVMRTYDKEK